MIKFDKKRCVFDKKVQKTSHPKNDIQNERKNERKIREKKREKKRVKIVSKNDSQAKVKVLLKL